MLIGLYNDWHRFDSANRHINIRKSILGVLKQITNLKSGRFEAGLKKNMGPLICNHMNFDVIKYFFLARTGRKSFMESDGIRVLYAVCQETLDCRELEGAITTARY